MKNKKIITPVLILLIFGISLMLNGCNNTAKKKDIKETKKTNKAKLKYVCDPENIIKYRQF